MLYAPISTAAFRKELGIAKGDALVMEVQNGELRIRPARAALTRLRDKLRAAKPDKVLFVEELIVDRRREAERDVDLRQAEIAGLLRKATRPARLSLGDRACLALANVLGGIAVTADQAWAGLKLDISIKTIR